jgi:hypothetical protein
VKASIIIISVVGLAGFALLGLQACSSTDSGGAGGTAGYGTGGGTGGASGGAGGGSGGIVTTGGSGGTGTGGIGTGGSGTGGSGTGGSATGGTGGSGDCPLTLTGASPGCSDCVKASCCNEFITCAQDTDCSALNTCVGTTKPDCSGAQTPAALKTCITAACPTSDAAYSLWEPTVICVSQSCATPCANG